MLPRMITQSIDREKKKMCHQDSNVKGIQSSQIVSRSKSPLCSAPQTLHLFRLSLDAYPIAEPTDNVLAVLRLASNVAAFPSAASAAAFNFAILSASNAASSASGESGIVSRLEMLGLLDRIDVGVEGTDEADENDDG